MASTEKRYVKRIVLPVTIAAAIAFVASLVLQESTDEEDGETNLEGVSTAAGRTMSDADRNEEIEAFEASVVSLDQQFARNENQQADNENMAAIDEQRERVENRLKALHNSDSKDWQSDLEKAYTELGAYARLIGSEVVQDGETSPKTES